MYDLAKSIVCSIIAAALSTTVTIVEGLLPLNPQWLERVANLAAHFRAVAKGEGPAEPTGETGPARLRQAAPAASETSAVHEDLQRILAAYQHLWDFAQAVKAKGLALDDDFIAKIEREWSVSTLLSYLKTADKTLQKSAADAQAAAARYLTPAGPGTGGTA